MLSHEFCLLLSAILWTDAISPLYRWRSLGSLDVMSPALNHTVGSGQVSLTLRSGSEGHTDHLQVWIPPLNQALHVYYLISSLFHFIEWLLIHPLYK